MYSLGPNGELVGPGAQRPVVPVRGNKRVLVNTPGSSIPRAVPVQQAPVQQTYASDTLGSKSKKPRTPPPPSALEGLRLENPLAGIGTSVRAILSNLDEAREEYGELVARTPALLEYHAQERAEDARRRKVLNKPGLGETLGYIFSSEGIGDAWDSRGYQNYRIANPHFYQGGMNERDRQYNTAMKAGAAAATLVPGPFKVAVALANAVWTS